MTRDAETPVPSSRDVLIQAAVVFLVEHLETTGKKCADLEKEISWDPECYRKNSLAEWIRCEDKTLEECLRVIWAVDTSIWASPPFSARETGPDPIALTQDAVTTPLYGSRPAEGYRPTMTSFVHEVSEEPPEAFGQKLRVLSLVLQNLFGDPTRRTPQERKTLVETLKTYCNTAKQVFGLS